MKAVIEWVRLDDNVCTAITDNGLAVVMSVTDGTYFDLRDEIELDLPRVMRSKRVRRIWDDRTVAVEVQRSNIRDLRVLGMFGTPTDVSDERMGGG